MARTPDRARYTRAAALALGLTAALSLAACGGAETGATEGGETIQFGYIGDFNGASLLAVAEDQGLWEEAGLDVETPVFNDGPTQIQALQTGDLDFGYIGPGAMWMPLSGQAKIVAINTIGTADRVVALPDSGIQSIEDLKGKKVGVTFGTSGEMILNLALQEAGMSKDDVQLVDMDPDVLVQALSTGQVDAAGFWYPYLDTVKEEVPGLVELADNSDFKGQITFPTAFIGAPNADTEDPETTKDVLSVLREANDFRAKHLDETIELTADMLDQPVENVEADAANSKLLTTEELDAATQNGTITVWLTELADYFGRTDQLQGDANPATAYTGDLWTRASAE